MSVLYDGFFVYGIRDILGGYVHEHYIHSYLTAKTDRFLMVSKESIMTPPGESGRDPAGIRQSAVALPALCPGLVFCGVLAGSAASGLVFCGVLAGSAASASLGCR